MKKKTKVSLVKELTACKRRIADERDKLREISDECEDLIGIADDAEESLDAAIETLSRYL